MPLKVVKLHVDHTPWMTPYLKDLIRKRQKALKENNTSLFKIYHNKVNSERKAAKSKYYQSKVEHLKDTDPKKWWSICKKISGMSKANTSIGNKLLETESPSTNSKIKLANDINSAFLEPLQSYSKLSPSSKTAVTDHPVPHVTIESVERKLRTIKEFKAPGPDDIPNWLLKNFSYLLAEPICYLINSSYQKQCLPTIWKKANVIPLPKNPHIQEFNKDLRPISLTPTLSKIAEDYVVQEHVKPAVLKHVRSDQYGCVPLSSTIHALIYLMHHWLEATDVMSSEVRVILMDYKKAFDLIDHNLLMSKLKSYEINPYILNWIHDFLGDRKQRVKLENDIISSWSGVLAGVPQGSKLGPWLFLVMINDLEIKSSSGNAIFVDDTTSFEIVRNLGESTAQVIVNEITNWSNQNKFQVQPRKCKELRISFKHAPSVFSDLYINGTPIEVVDSFQVLGLTIQSNLKWDQQVEKI